MATGPNEQDPLKELRLFFAGRTIGVDELNYKIFWRGSGDDDGWEDLSLKDLATLNRLVTRYLNRNRNT